MEKQLKLCAHCGGEPKITRTTGANYKIICSKCKMQTHAKCTIEVAAEIWNKRVHDRNIMEEFPYAGWSRNVR